METMMSMTQLINAGVACMSQFTERLQSNEGRLSCLRAQETGFQELVSCTHDNTS